MAEPVLRAVGCPLCGAAPSTGAGGEGDGSRRIEERGWVAHACVACGLYFVSPRPAPEALLAIYEHDASQTAARVHVAKARDRFATAHAGLLLGLVERARAAGAGNAGGARRELGQTAPDLAQPASDLAQSASDLARPPLAATREGLAPSPALLEIGAGGGALLVQARERGYEVAAIEPNPVLAGLIADRQIPCEQAPLAPASFAGRPFHVIVNVNVLSHFDDPVAAVAGMATRLVPGGLLVIETGNFADVHPRFHPLIRATERFQLPEHLTFFGERSLAALVHRAGLEIVAVHRYSRIPEKRGPRVLSALGLGRLTNRLRFWLTYRLGAWFPKRGRPQTVVVIARKPASRANLPFSPGGGEGARVPAGG